MKSLQRKPFYSSITIIVLLPLLILVLDIVLLISLGTKTIDENRIDKVFHVFGAVSAYFSAAGVLWHLVRRKIIESQNVNVLRALAFGFVCFVVISWEIFEYIFDIGSEFLTYSDTITDMVWGLVGGLVGGLFASLTSAHNDQSM